MERDSRVDENLSSMGHRKSTVGIRALEAAVAGVEGPRKVKKKTKKYWLCLPSIGETLAVEEGTRFLVWPRVEIT